MNALSQLPLLEQAVLALAALVLFLSFALLAQARLNAAITAFASQGVLLAAVTALVASDGEHHLFVSAALTLGLKALLIPKMLRRQVRRLNLERHIEDLERPELSLLAAIGLVIFSYWLVAPIEQLQQGYTGHIIATSLAVVLIGFLTMVTHKQAVVQVLGFMSIENGLFLAAVSATGGMPLVVELGIAFDVLVAMVLFGVFFLHIQENIETLDVDAMNHLHERQEESR